MALLDKIQAYWKLDESSGNAVDVVNGYTLTNINSVTYAPGIINNGADFGTTLKHSKRLSISSQCGWNPNIVDGSISFWVKVNTPPDSSGAQYFFSYFSSSRYYTMYYEKSGANLRLNLGFSGLFYQYNVDLGTTWHNIVLTIPTSGILKVYLDSSNVYSNSSGNSSGGSNNFNLGGSQAGDANYGSASIIDEVGLWNKVLSQTEVTELYNSGLAKQFPFGTKTIGISTLTGVNSITL